MAHPDWLEALLAKLPAELASQLSAFQTEVLIASLVTAAITVVFVFYLVTRPKAGGGTTVVLAGPCNAGKTTLFYQLKDGSTHNGTVASMQENQAAVAVKSQNGRKLGQVSLVDVPGHERLRNKLDHHLKDAAAVVLVVDSTDITPSKVRRARCQRSPCSRACRSSQFAHSARPRTQSPVHIRDSKMLPHGCYYRLKSTHLACCPAVRADGGSGELV